MAGMDTNIFGLIRSPECQLCNFYIVRIGIFSQKLKGVAQNLEAPVYQALVKVHPWSCDLDHAVGLKKVWHQQITFFVY